ncbi:nucleoside-diphosphate sugar epimerase [Arthrobacter sp. RIT-PI-e]|uniref:NAD(P)-dependent oxidoreductase n=1 Tax=Arthrobacter sp. RIT-PI-e TaxID=1681197 RepID=UPI0006769142|nr:NAD(P)H-binding protein [Arthrobacter sp. RIT-PI-e]KNC18844.1 nucleoside-diphosphate sugar epimerase [Arthrobacter sp. RIT-PI-e]
MKVLVLGATGPTGRHLLTGLLSTGHDVTALIRNPGALEAEPSLTVVQGDATIGEHVTRVAHGQQAIVSTLGSGRSVRPGTLFTEAAGAALRAAASADINRIVWLSSFGVGNSFAAASPTQKLIYSTLLRSLYANKKAADQVIRGSDLDWTLVYPTRLTDGPRTAHYTSAEDLPMQGNPTISRADVAHFMTSALSETEWTRKTVIITS